MATSIPLIRRTSSDLDFYDYQSKNLVDVVLTGISDQNVNSTFRATGTATMTELPAGMPLIYRPAWKTPLSFPLRVKFRLAPVGHPEAIKAFETVHYMYERLAFSDFSGGEDYLSWWMIPEEGLWAFAINRDAQPLQAFWQDVIRPPIVESERKLAVAQKVTPNGERASIAEEQAKSEVFSGEEPETLDLAGGYLGAVDVLIQVAEIVLQLHQRRLATVAVRPDWFQVVGPPHSKTVVGFQTELTRLTMVTSLTGYDDAKVIDGLPGQITNTLAAPFESPTLAQGSISPKAGGAGGALSGIYEEDVIRAHQAYLAPDVLASTRAYGVSVDMFSFGVMAYQLISEQLPYGRTQEAVDEKLLTLLSNHSVKSLVPLTNLLPTIPKQLWEIVRRCLDLNPTSRYVTSQALLYDLRQIRKICAGDQSTRDTFIVGDVDERSRFQFPLFPRTMQLKEIDAAYSDLRRSKRAQSICVWGSSGTGKTTLLETWLEAREASKETYFVGRANFHQHAMRPLSGLVQMIEDLLTLLWSDTSEDHNAWRQKIMGALGDRATIILGAMSTSWRDVLLNQTRESWSGKSVSPDRSDNYHWAHHNVRIRTSLSNFFRLFGTAKRPLILVADDIQFADPIERALLRDLVEHPERGLYHTLVCKSIGTEDDNESPDIPEKERDHTVMVHTGAVSPNCVKEMLKKALHIDGELDAPLAFFGNYVHTVTKGNLLSLNSLCHELCRTGVLFFDFETKSWGVRMSSLSLHRTADIGDFSQMIVDQLPEDLKSTLRVLAFLPPSGIPTAILGQLTSTSEEETSKLLKKAAMMGLVTTGDLEVHFQSDRLRTAVLSLAPEHGPGLDQLRIADRLQQLTGKAYLFTIADLLISVHSILGDSVVNPRDLRETLLEAAERASRSAAFALSKEYLLKVKELLEPDAWTTGRTESIRCVKLMTEAAGAIGEVQSVLPQIEEALQNVETVDERLAIFLLRVRAAAMLQDRNGLTSNIDGAFAISGLQFNELDHPPNLPQSVISSAEDLAAAFADRPPLSSEVEVERAASLLEMLAFSGPALFSSSIDAGLPYFDAGLAIILRYRAALRPAGAYILLMRAMVFVRDLQVDKAKICVEVAKKINIAGSYWAGYYGVTMSFLGYIATPSAKMVNYDRALQQLRAIEHHEAASRILGIRAFDRFFAGQISQKIVHEEAKDLELLVGRTTSAGRLLLSSMAQLVDNIMDPNSDVQALQYLVGTFIGPNDVIPQTLAYLSTLSYYLASLWVAVLFQADMSRLEKLSSDLAGNETAAAGLLLSVDARFLRSVVALSSEKPMTTDDDAIVSKTRATFTALNLMVEIKLRSKALDAFERRRQARLGEVHWLEALDTFDVAIDYAHKIQHQLIAGWMSLEAAKLIQAYAPTRTRLSSGYVTFAHDAWTILEARGLLRLLHARFPSQAPAKVPTPPMNPTIAAAAQTSSSRISAIVAASNSSGSERGVAGEDSIATEGSKLDRKLAMESVLSTFLTLASEKSSEVIRRKLLITAIQLQRGDWAALTVLDTSTNEMKLVASGFQDNIRTWDDLKISDAVQECPTSIISLVAMTKKGVRYGDPRTRHLFRKDPFWIYAPKSATCHPLSIQGRFAGCLVIASTQRPFNERSDSPVDLLATFALIALEANKTKSQLEAQISYALQSKFSFTTSLTHETRTPLFTILGLIEVLENTPGMTASQKENLLMIRTSSETLHKLIGDILDLSKLEAGGITSVEAPFDLRETIEEALDSLAHVAQAKSIELVFLTPFEMLPRTEMIGDAFRVRQCLLNLIGNAIKFTPAGGCVSVNCASVWEGSQCNVEMSVTDTGIGISEDQQMKLFKPFSQIDHSKPGSGLGLSITRNLSRVLGGDTWMKSSLGSGSTFFFSMVCRAIVEEVMISKIQRIGQGKRALIVGLQFATVDVLKENLNFLGLECISHSDPKASLYFYDVIFQCIAYTDNQVEKSVAAIKDKYPDTPTYYLMSITHEAQYGDRLPPESMVHVPVKSSKLIAIIERLFSATKLAVKEKKEMKSKIPPGFAEKHPLKLAFIDDNHINTQVGLKLLSKYGYKKGVDVGHDGAQALEMAKEAKYDLIFMDLQMPVMDGHQAMMHLRPTQVLGFPKVVALTANCDQATRDQCVQEGFTSFLEKPVNIAALTKVLEEVYEAKMKIQDETDGVNKEEKATVS